ncbi:vacuolar protein sorting protein VPS52 [Acrasis kona]|uniref:Vacuolar protein sorting protein VPS52 n=1 Tax=Acrasis kona TaxID=1008807 RepID=A0AAW2Z3Q5_9EUKA
MPLSPRKKSNPSKTQRDEDEKRRKALLNALEDEMPQTDGPTEVTFSIEDLDITSDDIDLDEIDEDILRFQQDELVQKALQQGVDLRDYGKDIEKELRQVEIDSIEDYLQEAERIADLYQQLCQCDGVLEKMEGTLQKFQGSLGNISDEIKTLQDESFSMNIRLKNRRSAEEKLASFINQSVIDNALVHNVCEEEVNEAYLDYLITLDMRNDFLKNSDNVSTQAAQELIPKLDKLNVKAVTKVRAFLLQKINELKKPKTNTQFLKQNVLLKFKYFADFLRKNNQEASLEVRNTYINTISTYYYNSFKSYIGNLLRLQQSTASKSELIVEKETFSLWGNTERGKNTFSIGDRGRILDEVDLNNPIVGHVAVEKKETYPFEALFRSMHVLLINTSTSEYIFIMDFFMDKDKMNLKQIRTIFGFVFKKTLELLQQTVNLYLSNNYDAIAVLIMIRITHQFMDIMEKRKIDTLDDYFNQMNLLLWPKFKNMFDQNLESVRAARENPRGVLNSERSTHAISKRYAELVSSIHILNKRDSTFKQMLEANLATLRDAYIGLLERTAAEIRPAKDCHIYKINSLDHVLTIFNAAKVSEVDDVRELRRISETSVARFMEDELIERYGNIVTFTKTAEEQVSKNSTPEQNQQRVNLVEMENIAKEFKNHWKAGVEYISTDVTKSFSNLAVGQLILKQIYIQLIYYYNRFNSVVKLCGKEHQLQTILCWSTVDDGSEET